MSEVPIRKISTWIPVTKEMMGEAESIRREVLTPWQRWREDHPVNWRRFFPWVIRRYDTCDCDEDY